MRYKEFMHLSKQQRSELAKKHEAMMCAAFAHEIDWCVANTRVYGPGMPKFIPQGFDTKIRLVPNDTVEEIHKGYEGFVCALNFASYNNPGGGYLSGMRAQEECLCHYSALYPILKRFDCSYYAWNREHKNKGMYLDRALFTPGVPFIKEDTVFCDVLTCAAPNYSVGRRYGSFTSADNSLALKQRIKFLLSVAACSSCEKLILGAFGCGVFENNPHEVARLFLTELKADFDGCFQEVVFAIPDPEGPNYKAFEKVFETWGVQ